MAHCPNCGLSTVRTKDWACQWCGYPLVSGIFGKTSKTFAELKNEREGGLTSTALLVESEPATEPEPETNQVADIEVSTVPEPEAVQETTADTAIAESAPEEEPEPGPVMAQAPTVEAKPEPVLETTVATAVAESAPEKEPETEPVMVQESTVEAEPAPRADKEPKPMQEVTVAELCSSYQSYGMAGHDEFKDSVFRVKGLVNSVVNKEVVGQYRVALTDSEPHPLGDVYCKFKKEDAPELNRLSVGQELTVDGKYEGFVTNIVLTDCALVA